MIGRLGNEARKWGGVFGRVKEPRLAILVAAVVILSLAYRVGAKIVKVLAASPSSILFCLALAIILAAAGVAAAHRARSYAEVWRPLAILLRGTAAVLFVQILFDALWPAAVPSNILIGTVPQSRLLILVAAILGGLAMWRPTFVFPMALTYAAFRMQVPRIYGLGPEALDFTTLDDVASYASFALTAWWTARAFPGFLPKGRIADAVSAEGSFLTYQKLVWALLVGIHIGNYFHSALAKIWLGQDDPLFWIVTNPTAQTIAIGLFRLNSPIAGWPWLVQNYYDLLMWLLVPFNLIVLALQLFSPLAVLNRRVLIIFTLAFDCMHLGIYLSLGAFFFFWIALNVVILLSLAAMEDRDFSPAVKITALVCAVLGYLSFNTATLGWLDGKKVVREIFMARLADGRQVLVPPATFGLFSYQIAHGSLYIPDDHFLVRFGGNAFRNDWADASTCGPATVSRQKIVEKLDSIDAMIRTTDAFYRRHPWIKDLGLFYAYPHHSPSNPAFFGPYDAARMAQIVGYSYIVESSCIGIAEGRLINDVRVRSEYKFDVRR